MIKVQLIGFNVIILFDCFVFGVGVYVLNVGDKIIVNIIIEVLVLQFKVVVK